ncbi:MAG: flavin reductase family protein [Dehalococcoidia bacterium]|nr:flavin reductase family protein [Dehalococcoidia bacterium]
MAKQLMEQIDVYNAFPTPLVLVSCVDEAGNSNILTIAWAGVVASDPPMVSFSMRRGKLSYRMLKSTGEFVINVPTAGLVKEMDYCGTASGKNVDKWKESGLTPLPATKVKAPLIAECPISLECVVRHTLHLGTHDCFIAEIVASHVDPAILKNGRINGQGVRPLVYFGRDYWALGDERLADRGVGMPKP